MSSAPAEVACPECGKVGTRQMHGGAGLLFKGSGFYLTDYGKNAHRADAKPTADTKADTKADAKADVKADPKPDAKPDAKSESKPKSETPKAESKPAKKPKSE